MKSLIALAGIAVFAMPAMAGVVIWDENNDGNLSDDPFAPTFLNFGNGDNIVRGSTLGSATPPSPGYDVFSFTVGAGFTLDAIVLSAYTPAAGGTSGFNFSSGASVTAGGALIFGPGVGGAAVGTDFLVTQGVGVLGADTYFMEIREFGGPLAEWELTFTVTPSPASLALLGFGGLVAGRRRR